MNTKRLYLVLSVLGFVVPYYFLWRFVSDHGFRLSVLVNQVFGNPVTAFFAADVIVSSLVLWIFMFREIRKRSINLWWVCIIANLAVGVSLALPLFLLLREIQIEREAP
ncbi:MAG TPA: DUF2834 domain-containing protein [Blastocatellia bacterium]|nr:DUF2834 domain-containing protein [Blastocatellia bacterium]